jgi:hypothetical protein
MRGVVMGRGLHQHTYNPFLKFEKKFEKKFGRYKIYVIPLGWWLGEVIFYASM